MAQGPEREGCVHARELRARAPKLLEEGRLDRAVRALQRAEDLCPPEAPATWGPRVTALAALGRSAETMQLARRIEQSDRASDADRAAAKAARASAEEHAQSIAAAGSRKDAPELFDPAEKRRENAASLFRQGTAAARAGDAKSAKKLFMDAWTAWHPNPRALVEAGLAAQALGERAEAQRLWDRAAYDDASTALHPEVPAGGPRAVSGAVAAWGTRILVGGDDELMVLERDLTPALRIRTGEGVTAVALAGDAWIAAGTGTGKIKIYDAALGTARGDLVGHQGPVRVISASPDGRTLATAADDTAVRLWNAANGEAGRIFATKRVPVACTWSADGARLAWADDGGNVGLAEVGTGAVVSLPKARGAVRALAFDGAALHAVTASERLVWNLDKPRTPPRTLGRARADLASIAGGVLASATTGEIAALDLASGAALGAVPNDAHGGLAAIAVAPDARAFAAVYRDRTLAVLPARERAARREISPASPLAALAVAASGKLFASASEDGRVLLWNAAPPSLGAFAAAGARALAFAPDTRTLAVGLDHRVDLHDLVAHRPGPALEAGGRVNVLAFSADGLDLAAATDAPAVEIFAAGAPKATRSLRLEGGPARAVRFAPDGHTLFVAAHDAVVRWDPDAPKTTRLGAFGPEPRDVVVAPDGAALIVADKRGELLTGKLVDNAPAPAHVVVPAQALALAIAANGMIATAEGDRALSLRGPDGKPIARFREPEAAVRAVAFLPQGIIAASFADGAVRLFRSPGPGPVAVLRPVPGLGAGALAGLVEGPGGHLEVLGPDAAQARARLRCRLGPALYPFDVCAEQFAMSNLLPLILSGQDPAEADP
ncbi:Protein kinase [Minicystis rosea]|nr:Protein kinase [Minicystis rosea]